MCKILRGTSTHGLPRRRREEIVFVTQAVKGNAIQFTERAKEVLVASGWHYELRRLCVAAEYETHRAVQSKKTDLED